VVGDRAGTLGKEKEGASQHLKKKDTIIGEKKKKNINRLKTKSSMHFRAT